MRIVSLLIVVLGVYLYFTHHSPVAPVIDEITAKEVAPLTTGPRAGTTTPAPGQPPLQSNLGRPISRTHDVLDQVKKRNGTGEF